MSLHNIADEGGISETWCFDNMDDADNCRLDNAKGYMKYQGKTLLESWGDTELPYVWIKSKEINGSYDKVT